MAGMDLDHVEVGPVGIDRGARIVVADALHVGARDLARDMHEFVERQGRCGHQLPVSLLERMVHALPAAPGGALAAGMTELQAEFGRALPVDEIADALPGRDLSVGIDAGTARRDAPRFRHRRHLGEHEAGAAHAEAAEMHQMEVARDAARLRRIHVHRRDDHAVRHHHLPDPERREHRRRRRVERHVEALLAHRRGEPTLHVLHELRIAHPQVLVGDGLGARQHAEAGLNRRHAPVARRVLGPEGADIRGVLGLLDVLPARALEARERIRYGAGCDERLVEIDRVLHGELGAGADGEMRGVQRIAEQDDVAVVPVLAADHREAAPRRAIGDEPMPLQSMRPQILQIGDGLGLAQVAD